MPLKTSISKWGSNLAVRIPQDIADDLEIKKGTSVELSLDDNVLRIRKTKPNLDEMITPIDPDIYLRPSNRTNRAEMRFGRARKNQQ